MKVTMSREEATAALSAAMNTRVNGVLYVVTEVQWDRYSSEVVVDMEPEPAAPPSGVTYGEVFVPVTPADDLSF